ncbi:MAG TPA: SusC/RagA family TonB-linked outer membrane protein [Longimicrobiales bacterium]
MRRVLCWLSSAALAVALLVPAAASAQQARQVTGRVTAAETGLPLDGVQVYVSGQNISTVTDSDGRYVIRVPEGVTTLVFSLIGYETLEAEITGNTLDVRLTPTAISLEGIVVTALGIEQQERALTSSVTEIGADEFTDVPEPNIVNALAGEATGVSTVNAGPAGGSARIIIRGATSISGDNQPLFVVDGVPIDNSGPDLDGYGGLDYGNAAQDLNPADIASVSILKGPNAAALYGSRAANGAIIITTKDGRGAAAGSGDGARILLQSNTTWSNPLRLPEYQNVYGQGYGGEFSYVDGLGNGVNDYADESWGPPCDGRPVVQWWSNGEPAPFNCYPDNVKNFFETGLTTYNNLSVAVGGERSSLRISASNEHIDGMYPGFQQDKWTAAVNGNMQLTDRFRADGSVNYIRKEAENRPGIGYGADNFMQQFVWFGRSVSMERLRQAYFDNAKDRKHVTWNPLFHTNPYWIALQNDNFDDRNRVIGNVALSYDLADGVTATLRTGTDWYEDVRKRTYYQDNTNHFYDNFAEDVITRSETNVDLLVNVNRSLTEDVTVNATIGGNHRYAEDNFHYVTVPELTVPGVFAWNNAARPAQIRDWISRQAMNSVYGQAQFGYRNYLFLQVTGRNDWSSTLPEANNSYFYPSVSGSFIFTDAFQLPEFLTFGKVRVSWARVGNDADPYQLLPYYTAAESFNGEVPAFAVPDVIPNAELKPERTESWEIGADLRFFDNRLGLEATYYDMVTFDQILATDVSAASGYYQQVVNAGSIANRGIEVGVTATPVELDNGFRWDMAVNFSKNESEVEELAGDLQTYQLGSFWQVTTEARVGEAYGALYGTGFKRDDQGRIIVNEDGLPLGSDERIMLGNYTPEWIGSLSNTFSFKGLNLSFLLDTRQGGELFSVTQAFGQYTGVLAETLKGRENSFGSEYDADGNFVGYVCDPGFVVPNSVHEDGTENTTKICPNEYYKWMFGEGIREGWTYDASYVKLREARLSYTLPESIMERLPFSSVTVALVGRNLALWTDMPNIDPETAFDAGNSQGFEFGQIPSARSFGVNFTVTP